MSSELIKIKKEDFNLLNVVKFVAPKFETIDSEIYELRKRYPRCSDKELADKYNNSFITKYTSIGAASALPSAIPGIGTAAQIALEASGISVELSLMLRYMAAMCYGTAKIHGRENINEFDNEFVLTLGLWCGVIDLAKKKVLVFSTKAGTKFIMNKLSGEVLKRINRKVGMTIFTKYGTKRGAVAIGRAMPFLIGSAVGGVFNYYTLKSFKKAAEKRYTDKISQEYVLLD